MLLMRLPCLLSSTYYLHTSLYFFPVQDTTPQLICKLEAQVIYFLCIPPTLPSPQILVKEVPGRWAHPPPTDLAEQAPTSGHS